MAISIHDLDRAASMARQIRDIEREIQQGQFGVQVNPGYRDEETLAAINAAIIALLRGRADVLRTELAELGVVIA